ncbi:MAG: hypothetical protein AMS20_08225 [Gemmatimonas sp. SG8_28]|nr:MAG: hypothetical protein AMS20_08225 [Gemmatimonas sp. SG8_28]
MRTLLFIPLLLLVACVGPRVEGIRSRDLEQAALALEQNLRAIAGHDVDAYLSQYLDSPDLIVASADSLRRGYLMFAEARRASTDWPDTLIAGDPTLVWIAPGVVWAAFEYGGVVGADTARGWSERLFVKTQYGWKIAVTGMMERN